MSKCLMGVAKWLLFRDFEKLTVRVHCLVDRFDAPVWRVSWSITGNVLAVSTGDHKVTLWKQAVDGNWIQIRSLEETSES